MQNIHFIETILYASGKIALKSFGKIQSITQKEDPNQIVTEVDIAIEKEIVSRIVAQYPTHSIIAEESGFKDKKSEYTWIIDPLDGTSNYASGIPWFGIMVALLKDWKPYVSGILLPYTNEMYLAEKGKGAFKNGKNIKAKEKDLKDSLVSFCADKVVDPKKQEEIARLYKNIFALAKNIRATNSADDYVYAADGSLGGAVNLNNKIWDVAPIIPIVEEAGGIVTDTYGNEIDLKVDRLTFTKTYEVVIGNRMSHPQLLKILSSST
jgi:myo-inositol-1(or 4)-monophosphatase